MYLLIGLRSHLTFWPRNISARLVFLSALKRVEENSVPSWLWRSVPDEEALAAQLPEDRTLRVRKCPASRYLIALQAPGPIGAGRVAILTPMPTPAPFLMNCATCSAPSASAPNSPQWFNTGLHWAYGIDGPSQGHHYVDFETGKLCPLRLQPTNIPSPMPASSSRSEDDLVNEGGIMDLWVREARLFKYGSGTGTNFSSLRSEGEALSGGGKSPPVS